MISSAMYRLGFILLLLPSTAEGVTTAEVRLCLLAV